ncbi:Imm71 family immunity protein [Aromatoleum evansii]|uniref:Imm71 family immunity protein n=1 Tax=Aromatoleum evansii TaxID=59406 RepID=A0ABZ1ASB1_AROEV|nr:Imm71 family immunity protein [Aromatoleum evansii]
MNDFTYNLDTLPNEEERRRIFYMLKKNSSYTAWARVGKYYDRWMHTYQRAFEEARQAGRFGFGNFRSDYACYCGFAECLKRLLRGDKRPFKFLGQHGHFYQAGVPMQVWGRDISFHEFGEGTCVAAMKSPLWAEFEAVFTSAGRAWGEIYRYILEDRYIDKPAPLGLMAYRGPDFLRDKTTLPDGELPPVPAVLPPQLVRSGDTVPCSGIWEPVKADFSGGFLGLFRKPLIPPGVRLPLDGTMNYLHGGSPAPNISFEGDADRDDGRPTVWQLLWRDDRYEDGTIPPEEADYTFRCPEYPAPPWKEFQPGGADGAQTASGEARPNVPAGQPCPEAGWWLTPAQASSRRYFNEGEIMPALGGDYGQTFWQWAPDQAAPTI